MKEFSIQIDYYDPFPKKFISRVQATSIATASARALRNFKYENKRKRIKKLKITITDLGKII